MTATSHSCTLAGACSMPPKRPRTAVIRSLLARIASTVAHAVVAMHSPRPRSIIIESPTKPCTSLRTSMTSVSMYVMPRSRPSRSLPRKVEERANTGSANTRRGPARNGSRGRALETYQPRSARRCG